MTTAVRQLVATLERALDEIVERRARELVEQLRTAFKAPERPKPTKRRSTRARPHRDLRSAAELGKRARKSSPPAHAPQEPEQHRDERLMADQERGCASAVVSTECPSEEVIEPAAGVEEPAPAAGELVEIAIEQAPELAPPEVVPPRKPPRPCKVCGATDHDGRRHRFDPKPEPPPPQATDEEIAACGDTSVEQLRRQIDETTTITGRVRSKTIAPKRLTRGEQRLSELGVMPERRRD